MATACDPSSSSGFLWERRGPGETLGNLMADAGSRIASIDVNPFLINTRTGVAVDALIALNNAAAAKSAAGH